MVEWIFFGAELILISGLLGLFFCNVNKCVSMGSTDPTLRSGASESSEATSDGAKGTPGKQTVVFEELNVPELMRCGGSSTLLVGCC